MKFYLAGKITGDGWRNTIVSGLAQVCDPEPPYPWPIMHKSIFGIHDYIGPYFMNNHDALAYHDEVKHEFNNTGHGGDESWMVHHSCLKAIEAADVVFAWIDQDNIHGTLIEMGYARGRGKPVWAASPARLSSLWFAYRTAWPRHYGFSAPRHALRHLLLQEYLPIDMYQQNRPGYIYILRAGPYYKIGRAKSIDNRVKQITLQLPFPVELLHSIETPDYIAAEHTLHNQFAADRTNGEWFKLHSDDVEWLLQLKIIHLEDPM